MPKPNELIPPKSFLNKGTNNPLPYQDDDEDAIFSAKRVEDEKKVKSRQSDCNYYEDENEVAFKSLEQSAKNYLEDVHDYKDNFFVFAGLFGNIINRQTSEQNKYKQKLQRLVCACLNTSITRQLELAKNLLGEEQEKKSSRAENRKKLIAELKYFNPTYADHISENKTNEQLASIVLKNFEYLRPLSIINEKNTSTLFAELSGKIRGDLKKNDEDSFILKILIAIGLVKKQSWVETKENKTKSPLQLDYSGKKGAPRLSDDDI
jgi:hypothetical protein